MPVYCTYIAHILHIHCTYIARTLHVYCTYFARTFHLYWSFCYFLYLFIYTHRFKCIHSIDMLLTYLCSVYHRISDWLICVVHWIGHVCVGNLNEYLPFILKEIEDNPKRQYLLLQSLKEVNILHLSFCCLAILKQSKQINNFLSFHAQCAFSFVSAGHFMSVS